MIKLDIVLENCKNTKDPTVCKNEINSIYKKLSDLQNREKFVAYRQSGAPDFTQDGIGAFFSDLITGYHSDRGKYKREIDNFYFRENNKAVVINLVRAMYPHMNEKKIAETADKYIREPNFSWNNAVENGRENRIVSTINASANLATEIALLRLSLGNNQIKLRNGYYEVAGMKISKGYYERLWRQGRPAPFIQAREVLKSNPKIFPDKKPGFYRYEAEGLELIYNPKTGEIWHIQPKINKR